MEISENVVPKSLKEFSERYKYNKETIKRVYYRTGLSDFEIMLILTFAINKAAGKLRMNTDEQYKYEHEFYFVKSWVNKELLTVENYQKAVKHLAEVCEWYKERGLSYGLEWLVDAESRMEAYIRKVVKGKDKNRIEVIEEQIIDLKQKIGDI